MMSNIKFAGVTPGATLSLTTAMGLQVKQGSVIWKQSESGGGSGKSVSLTLVRAFGPAPMAAFVKSEVSGFAISGVEAERKLDYILDFDDPGKTSPALTARSDALWGRDTNTCYLPRGSHTYDTPGQYTAQVWVSDGVDVVTDTVVIDVSDPDVVFTGTRTIYVDPDGTLDVQHAGAPAGAQYAATTAEAYTKWLDFDSAGGRILFAQGKTHDPFPDQFTAAKHVMLGAYGTGAKPVIDCAAGTDGTRPTEHVLSFRCSDLHFLGDWDGATETGSRNEGIGGNVDSDATIHNNEFTNLGAAIHLNAAITDAGWYAQISNNRIRGWQNYGILLPRPQFAGFVGNEIKQNPDALGGGLGKTIGKHEHGPIRTSAVRASGFVTFRKNELFSCTGWSTSSGRPLHQACIRWASSGKEKDATGFFEQNIMEGGGGYVMSFRPGSSPNANRGNIIFQMNYLLRTANSYKGCIDNFFTGIVIRNNIFVTPAVLSETDGSALSPPLAIKRSDYADADHEAALMEFYNNTHVDLRTDAQADGSGNLRWFGGGDLNLPPNVVHVNGAEYAPNRTDTGDKVVDVATVLFAPYYKGRKWANEPTLDTSFATPPGSPAAATPAAGDTGITGLTAMRDLLGTERPTDASTRTVGARQHAA